MRSPSGDQAGKHDGSASDVSCCRPEPSVRISQSWLTPDLALAKTMNRPVGDGNG